MKKIREIVLLALRIRPASPINAGFFAAPIILAFIAPLYWRYVDRTASPNLPELAY